MGCDTSFDQPVEIKHGRTVGRHVTDALAVVKIVAGQIITTASTYLKGHDGQIQHIDHLRGHEKTLHQFDEKTLNLSLREKVSFTTATAVEGLQVSKSETTLREHKAAVIQEQTQHESTAAIQAAQVQQESSQQQSASMAL